jgi:hypothetical protein
VYDEGNTPATLLCHSSRHAVTNSW